MSYRIPARTLCRGAKYSGRRPVENGLELESVSLTNFNQTSKEHFNPNNAFDAEGLTKLTQETERRRRERNEVEQDVEVAVREKSRCAIAQAGD